MNNRTPAETFLNPTSYAMAVLPRASAMTGMFVTVSDSPNPAERWRSDGVEWRKFDPSGIN